MSGGLQIATAATQAMRATKYPSFVRLSRIDYYVCRYIYILSMSVPTEVLILVLREPREPAPSGC